MSSDSLPSPSVKVSLSAFQRETIELFVHATQVLGMPKSIGEIYGLLFASLDPLTLDGIVDLLAMSKGSASQGLRFLHNLNAVKKVYMPGDRRDHYVAELRLRSLVTGFLRERVEPHMDNGADRLTRLEALPTESPEEAQLAFERIKRLRSWHKQSDRLIPVVRKILAVT